MVSCGLQKQNLTFNYHCGTACSKQIMSTTLAQNTICQFKDLILTAQNDLNLKA